MHKKIHKERVTHQKEERKQREAIANGRVVNTQRDRLGLRSGGSGGGRASPYKTHRIAELAQFSGATDRKVTGVPCDNENSANDDLQQKLENELQLRFRHTHTPSNRSTPKLKPF